MYECDIIELEDFGLNHYIHHWDEIEGDGFGYDAEIVDYDSMWEIEDANDWE